VPTITNYLTEKFLQPEEAQALIEEHGEHAGVVLVTRLADGTTVTDVPTIRRIVRVARVYGLVLADLAEFRAAKGWAIPLEAKDLVYYEPDRG